MIRSVAAFIALSVFVLVGAVAPVRAETQRYSVLSSGETVGWLIVDRDGDSVSVDYHVDNNGRGPKNRQRLRLDPAGYPLSWTIDGTSTFGGAVEERFEQSGGLARWTSQADAGEVAAPAPTLYVANDDSPWSLALYAGVLKAAPDGALDVAPGGRLSLTEVRCLAVGPRAVAAVVYRITGLSLAPSYVMLDADGGLLAEVGGGSIVVRDDLKGEEAVLNRLHAELEQERIRDLQSRLARRFDGPVRLRNVHIFDPRTGQRSDLSSVTVYGERIAVIEPETGAPAEPGVHVIDGEGGTLVPGLHDMHSHSSMSGGLLYLAAGVTSTRDMGNDNGFLLDLIRQIDDGVLPGPRITRTGLLEGRSPFAARNGIVVDSLDEALAGVRWYADHGYRQLKIYNSLHPEWVAPSVAEAHRLGLGVTGHVPAFVSPDQAIEAGYDDVAHVNQLMLGWLLEPGEDSRTTLRLTAMPRAASLDLDSASVQHTLDLMRRHGVALDTTAVALEVLMLSRAGEIPPTAEAFVDHMPIGYQRYRRRSFVEIGSPQEDAAYYAGFAKILETIGRVHEAEIVLLPGTDDGVGFTVHRELELYVKAGLTPAEALRLATLSADQYLGVDQSLGTIERGKLADFFLVPGNPVQDINAIREIRLVMKGGVAYTPADIHQALGIRPFAEAVVVQSPTRPDRIAPDRSGEDAMLAPAAADGHVH